MRLAACISWFVSIFVAACLPSLAADELDTYLASQERLLEDSSIRPADRAGIALEMAASLDRAAGRARTLDERRGRWERAVAILDRFSRANAGLSESRNLQTQAAVFEWAIGASWLHQARLSPLDPKLRKRAVESLEDSIERFQMLLSASENKSSPLARQIRLRLARALRDRAELDPSGSRAATERLTQALGVLGNAKDLGDLAGLAGIERCRILLALDRADEAQEEIDAIAEKEGDAPESELWDVRVRTLLARAMFSEADRVLGSTPGESPRTHQLRLELALRRWGVARSKNDAETQRSAESAAFAEVRALQESGGDEAIEGLLRLSSELTEPSDEVSAADLDLLAQGRLRSGRPEEASRLELRASEASKAEGDGPRAATYRLRAAGILLRSKHRIQARHLLDQIADDESAGTLRPKAALLSALSMREESARERRVSMDRGYEEALNRLIERFPGTSEASEALWLLGLARQARDEGASASALWERIPEDHPRWLDAQLARASLRIDSIESRLAEGDQRSAEQEMLEAREALDRMAAKVETDSNRAELVLARSRLETLPNLGDPRRTVDDLDRLLTQPLDPAQRGQAERLRVLALLELGRSVEAMRATRSLLDSSNRAIFWN